MENSENKPTPEPKEPKRCKRKGCFEEAIFLEEYCWEHLPKEVKKKYKYKIEKWVAEGKTLEGVNLIDTDLSKVNLMTAQLKGANLMEANLQGTYFAGVEPMGGDFVGANLEGATLTFAKLQEATLVFAVLNDARLEYAELQKADLTEANLKGAFLENVQLDGAINLNWDQVEIVGEEQKKCWIEAKKTYLNLKNYFHQQGRYQDESNAYYREKLMEKHETFWKRFKKYPMRRCNPLADFTDAYSEKQPLSKIKGFFRWFWLWIFWALTGFGERPGRTIAAALLTILLFGCIYWLGASVFSLSFPDWLNPHNPLYYFYFSVVTFATLGFGDISPGSPATAALVTIEVIFGYVFLGLIVTLIARKMGR